jgi:hypothetical protein
LQKVKCQIKDLQHITNTLNNQNNREEFFVQFHNKTDPIFGLEEPLKLFNLNFNYFIIACFVAGPLIVFIFRNWKKMNRKEQKQTDQGGELWRDFRFIIPSFFNWFTAGYDLVLIILLGDVVRKLFFPSIDPTDSILALYATLSLSLLARLFGGALFGPLGDKYGQKLVLKIIMLSLAVIMLFSAFYQVPTMLVLF